MTKLDAFINKNLPKVLAEHTVNSLGDRSTYIGASDIGGCIRSAYLGKNKKLIMIYLNTLFLKEVI